MDRRLRSRAAALSLALAAVLPCACGSRAPRANAHGVLIIAIDGLRADHLGVMGYDRDTSPTLSALAKDGALFRQAFSSAPQLLPAHVAVLTGCEPTVARRFPVNDFEGLTERRWSIPESVPHMAVEFLAAGYATAAFVDHPLLSGVHGFATGFQRYEILAAENAEDWEGAQTTRVLDHFLQWLRGLEPGRSWFAYLHLNQLDRFWSDPSAPADSYFQPRAELDIVPPVGNTDSVFFAVPRSRWHGRPRTLGQYEASYDDEIRKLDSELERLCASLRRIGRFDATTLHVLGTFGMQFGEAGLYLCAGRYSRADLAVPWIVRPRSDLGVARGRVLDGLASLVDVAPTALELEGLTLPAGMHGRSQAPVLRAVVPALERHEVFASCGVQEGCAVIGERYALEWLLPSGTADAQLRRSWLGEWSEFGLEPRLVFYDRRALAYPPLAGETSHEPEIEFRPLRAAAVEWLRDQNDVRLYLQAPPGRSGLGEAELARLRAKGYVGAGP